MYCNQFKFAAIFLCGITATTGGKFYCTPSSEGTLTECNWCYCIKDDLPICTTMDCTKVPKELWGKLDIPMGHKMRRFSLPKAAFDVATKGIFAITKMLGPSILSKIMGMLGKTAA